MYFWTHRRHLTQSLMGSEATIWMNHIHQHDSNIHDSSKQNHQENQNILETWTQIHQYISPNKVQSQFDTSEIHDFEG